MEKTQFIKDIAPGDEVRGIFLLGAAELRESRNGPFWRLELKDSSGALEAKIWSPQSREYAELMAGALVEAIGRCGSYRDQPQASVERLRVLSEEEVAACDLSLFLPCAPCPPQAMLEELERLIRKEAGPWKKFLLAVLRDDGIRAGLLSAPAAKNVHHAYVGGLLEHTLSVTGLALRLCDHYPELDRALMAAAAVCHDLGKIWELSGGLRNDYTDAGRLLGHITLGLERLEPLLRKHAPSPEQARHFKHLILSHHGEHQFGSPQLPQTAEAFVLHYADNIDAKTAQCRSIFSAFDDGEEGWSSYQPTLGRFLYRPARNAESAAQEDGPRPKASREDQCSLLSKE